jgi:hypothetical protein
MRIDWTPPLRPAATKRDERGAAARPGSFAASLGDPAPPTVAGTGGAAAVDGLFALQEVPDALTGRRRALARGTALLDRLEELRLALLAGTVSPDRLGELARQLRDARPPVDDPALGGVLDEIELRVAVELAKYAAAR